MEEDFAHTIFGNTGMPVHRLGLSATHRPGRKTIHKALDAGVNFFFCYGIDTQMHKTLRDLPSSDRERCVIATGAYNLLFGHLNLRRTLEKRLRQLGTERIDVFQYQGVTQEKHLTEHVLEEFDRFREEGKVRCTGITIHHRKFAGRLAADGALDTLMVRYNAAHRGAEEDIFPHLAEHNPGIVSYTATRWGYLLRRPKGWPEDGRVPTPGMCYRFALSNPHVHVCMMAPSNEKQFDENLAALEEGPLEDEEMEFMCAFGDQVHHTKRWFM